MIKTVYLTAGTETKVEISGGYNVGVINRTADMLYASKNSGISAGADDVAAIPAGDSYVIRAADDTVYLLATAAGDVQLESLGAKEVFKVAATRTSSGGGEGGTVDEVARQAIASHANHDEIHLTAEDAIEAAATAISNPNLVINPDFQINQRGQTEYTLAGYAVDGWRNRGNTVLNHTDTRIRLSLVNKNTTGAIEQIVENPAKYAGKTVTLSIDGNLTESGGRYYVQLYVNGAWYGSPTALTNTERETNSYTITLPNEVTELRFIIALLTPAIANASTEIDVYSVKLELGTVATPFTPPDPATELVKCQRFYQIHTTGDIDPIDLRPSMATITDIRQREDGNYEYIAEL